MPIIFTKAPSIEWKRMSELFVNSKVFSKLVSSAKATCTQFPAISSPPTPPFPPLIVCLFHRPLLFAGTELIIYKPRGFKNPNGSQMAKPYKLVLGCLRKWDSRMARQESTRPVMEYEVFHSDELSQVRWIPGVEAWKFNPRGWTNDSSLRHGPEFGSKHLLIFAKIYSLVN